MTAADFRAHFVDAFPASKTRERLYLRWERHLLALSSVLPVKAQWIDGSFVTSKTDPNDIDIVSVMSGLDFDKLAPAQQAMALAMLDGPNTQAVWGMDSYAVLEYPAGHAAEPRAQAVAQYWDEWWQRQRGQSGLVKGYLEVLP